MFRPVVLRQLGGLDENEDPTSLKQTALVEARNTARFGLLTGTRPGFGFDGGGEYPTEIDGTPAVQGIVEWSIGRDATREVVVVAGGEIWTGPTNPTDMLDKAANGITISSGADNLWTFADHNDHLYAAGGAVGDHFWCWDGTADPERILVVNSSAQALQPKYVFHWKNYMFLSGLQGRALPDDNPLVWRFHDLGTDPSVAANWPTSNTIGGSGIGGLPGYGSEFSTGTAQFQDNTGSYLLLLTNKRIYSYVQDPNSRIGFVKNDEISNGCVSQLAFVDLGLDSGDAIYMSEVGIHSLRLSQQYSGRARAFLSWPIRNTFATLNRNRLKYIVAGYWPTEGIVAFAVPTGSSSTNDTILAMDIQEADEITPETVRWYQWNLAPGLANESITYMTFGRDSDNLPVLYVGTSLGKVGVANRTTYLDFGEEYETTFATKHDDLGAPGVDKTIGDLHLVARGNGTYTPTHQYVFDYGRRQSSQLSQIHLDASGGLLGSTFILGSSGVLGGELGIVRRKFYGFGRAEVVSHRFSHNPSASSSEPFFVASISQQFAATGESESDATEAA